MRRSSVLLVGVTALAVAAPAIPASARQRPRAVAKKDKKAKKPKKASAAALEKGMKVVVLGSAVVLDDPSEEGEEVFTVGEGDVLTVVRLKKGGTWVRVENRKGDAGWLRAAEVVPKDVWDQQQAAKSEDDGDRPRKGKGFSRSDKFEKGKGGDDEDDEDDDGAEKTSKKDKQDKKDKGKKAKSSDDEDDEDEDDDERAAASAKQDEKAKKTRSSNDDEDDEDDDEDDDEGGRGGGSSGGFTASLDVAGGASLVVLQRQQKFSSDGTNEIANYKLTNGSPGAAVLVGGSYALGVVDLGLAVGFMTTFGNDGVAVGEGATAATLAWKEQQIDTRLSVAYPLASGYVVAARAGYRQLAITIDESMLIKQPSERLSGVTLGVDLALTKLYPALAVHVGVETMVAATLVQTDGYKDGDSATVAPYAVFLQAGYELMPQIEAVLGYTLGYETYEFTGASQRDPANVNGKRTDLQHTVLLGAQYRFL